MNIFKRFFPDKTPEFRFQELDSLESQWGREALAIYEEAFPIAERETLEDLKQTVDFPDEADKRHHFRLMIGADNSVLGIAILSSVHSRYMAFLRFFAVRQDLRSRGYGRFLLEDAKAVVRKDGRQKMGWPYMGIALEVEQPERAMNADELAIRERRIRWYQRNGVKLVPSIKLITPPVSPEQPPMHYLMMFAVAVPKFMVGARLKRMMVESILIAGYGEQPDSWYVKESLRGI